jgi:site-specific DNA-methyltransferase (adenine-specific)
MVSSKDKISFKHPATFPEKLVEDHILSWSNPDDVVLDPMCGSGTTCKMAKKNNRGFIGIDISQEYVDIANKRLSAL